MFKIEYSEEFIKKIDIFIRSYKNIFISLFKWSWLVAEEEIIKNYIKTSQILRSNIFKAIEETATRDIVFGRSYWENETMYFRCKINTFRIFVYFYEKENTRFIEDIEFFKK